MSKRALVTGGGGFLGLYIVEALLADGWQVRVFCRGQYQALLDLDVEVINGDLVDSGQITAACADIDVVFHVASKTGPWGNYQDFYATNVLGTENVIAGCLAQGVKKLIYTSSPSVLSFYDDLCGVDEAYPFPEKRISAYQETKMLAEQRVIEANSSALCTTALRPHAIWGPRDTQLFATLMDRIKQNKLKIIGDGKNKISVSYVENTAKAHLQAAQSDRVGGQVYFINEEQPVELWSWINELVASVGLKPVTKKVPYGLAYVIGSVCEWVCRVLPFLGDPPITRALVSVSGKHHYFDVSKAKRDFGFHNAVSMEEAKQRFATYFKGIEQ